VDIRKLPLSFLLLSVAGFLPQQLVVHHYLRITTAPIDAGNPLTTYLTYRYSGYREQSFSVIVIVG
jgi:hypothetical protein